MFACCSSKKPKENKFTVGPLEGFVQYEIFPVLVKETRPHGLKDEKFEGLLPPLNIV
jgi:hypothetical protein